jgi:MHS family proline/betaine transporter-like MFS transporter
VIAFAYPLFVYLGDQPTFSAILWTQLILSIFASAYAAPTSAFLVDLFPVNQRYSGIAIAYSLGYAIFGGLTTVLITTIVQAHGFTVMPALCIIATCFLGFLPLSQNAPFFKSSLNPSTN